MCVPGEYCPTGTKWTQAGEDAGQLANATWPCGGGSYCKDYAAGAQGMYTWLSDYMEAEGYTIEDLHPSFSSCMYDAECPCEGGYHCPAGAHAHRATWVRCPPGYYCPAGSAEPTACPVGTFSESEGASMLEHCEPCPPGYACLVEALDVSPAAAAASHARRCPAGYYCTYGTGEIVGPDGDDGAADAFNAVLTEIACEAGYECPADSFVKRECQPGTYQPATG
jgi:hypothetical protein